MSYLSRVVHIGDLALGGQHPIRLQSMTNTPTLDTQSTVAQTIRIVEAGADMVRITAPGLREAEHLAVIKKKLQQSGYYTPLIADIHFNPKAAESAARIVEKVRINPGNYVDRPTPGKVDYTDDEYRFELERIAERLMPLLLTCSKYGTTLRIGVNHGSLSQRILSRYGDTAEGMVQSAMEFTRICHQSGFHNLVLSLKSSNVLVMTEACRLLAQRLTEERLYYPLHLGVTEAGDGEDGRLKSISGIGALLSRGIGDTIRVSLTEAPEAELAVAQELVNRFQQTYPDGRTIRSIRPDLSVIEEVENNRETLTSAMIGGDSPVAVILKQGESLLLANENGETQPLPHRTITLRDESPAESAPAILVAVKDCINQQLTALLDRLEKEQSLVLLAEAGSTELRHLAKAMADRKLKNPLILKSPVRPGTNIELLTEISLNPGNLLIDGIGNGICIEADNIDFQTLATTGFGLLQATRRRISKTEYIACPSCGRTLFNIQETLQQVKARTGHLKGLKIGVMGCIVNGPGEMADADYGYVGAGNGKVTLYKGKVPVKKGIPESEAVEALVALIKENGRWTIDN